MANSADDDPGRRSHPNGQSSDRSGHPTVFEQDRRSDRDLDGAPARGSGPPRLDLEFDLRRGCGSVRDLRAGRLAPDHHAGRFADSRTQSGRSDQIARSVEKSHRDLDLLRSTTGRRHLHRHPRGNAELDLGVRSAAKTGAGRREQARDHDDREEGIGEGAMSRHGRVPGARRGSDAGRSGPPDPVERSSANPSRPRECRPRRRARSTSPFRCDHRRLPRRCPDHRFRRSSPR